MGYLIHRADCDDVARHISLAERVAATERVARILADHLADAIATGYVIPGGRCDGAHHVDAVNELVSVLMANGVLAAEDVVAALSNE